MPGSCASACRSASYRRPLLSAWMGDGWRWRLGGRGEREARAAMAARASTLGRSCVRQRPDVLVEPEQVARIVLALELAQPIVVATVRRADPVAVVLRQEVHVDVARG